MQEIIFVSPQRYLARRTNWRSTQHRSGYVPILKSDLPRFQELWKHKVPGNSFDGNALDNPENASDSLPHTKLKNQDNDRNDSTKKIRYRNPMQFLPISEEERQLGTVALTHVPTNLINSKIEQLVAKLLELIEVFDSTAVWTAIVLPGLETKDVFIRFSNNQETGQIVSRWRCLIFPIKFKQSNGTDITINMHHDIQVIQKADTRENDVDRDAIQVKLRSFIETFLTDQDAKEAISEPQQNDIQYQIDKSTLSDIPERDLDQLCKDIIEFRTRAISLDKERQMLERHLENKKSKQRMQQLFDQIKRSQYKRDEDRNSETIDENPNLEDEDEVDAVDVSDYMLEQQRIAKEKEDANKRYKSLLEQKYNTLNAKLQSLQVRIQEAAKYEEELEIQRPIHLKELHHLANDEHYDHRRTFRLEEEENDRINRETEKDAETELTANRVASQPQKATEPDRTKTAEPVKIELNFRKSRPKVEPTADIKAAQDILPYEGPELQQRLAALKQSRLVDELVKQYLGVYEDELVEYIIENIREHRSKALLTQELQETFDQDGATIVDAIWKCADLA